MPQQAFLAVNLSGLKSLWLAFNIQARMRSLTRKPWANIFLGIGSPADISMPGQYTAWKRRMSLPTKCTLAGQPRACSSFGCASTPSGSSAADTETFSLVWILDLHNALANVVDKNQARRPSASQRCNLLQQNFYIRLENSPTTICAHDLKCDAPDM